MYTCIYVECACMYIHVEHVSACVYTVQAQEAVCVRVCVRACIMFMYMLCMCVSM